MKRMEVKNLDLKLEDSNGILKKYKRNLHVVSPECMKAIEEAKESIKTTEIAKKIQYAKSDVILACKQIKKAIEHNEICKNIEIIKEQQLNFYNTKIIEDIKSSINDIILQIAEMQKYIVITIESLNQNFFPSLKKLELALEIVKNNPDSYYNWTSYYNRLSEFFWILPYQITTRELYEMLKDAKTEKEFDQRISKYFNNSKVKSLIKDIKNMLPNNNQRKIFDQIIKAYENRSYALASLGLITMIDNALSYYLINKACSSRLNLFEPIIYDLMLQEDKLYFIVMMVNSNINLLYEQIEFNGKISIHTNKKARRNPASHGKAFSLKKIDSIMLMNTFYYLLVIQNKLKKYRSSLCRNRMKKFYIPTKEEKRKIKESIKANL